MCGIVGIYLKTPELESELGTMLASMLVQMSERGPDSAGIAVYREAAGDGAKITLQAEDDAFDWNAAGDVIRGGLDTQAKLTPLVNHAVLTLSDGGGCDEETATVWLENNLPQLRITSIGRAIEIYKEKGLPGDVIDKFSVATMRGSHALGHTRMATESAVTTAHSHPFSSGLDLCLVHNGSLSNHNRLREKLRGDGIRFYTDNDSEVAAGYLTWRLSQGASLVQALESARADLDGFYTFAIGARDGFAVMRDAIACKPAVLAESDDWVAMASEYRAIAQLPGCEDARVWEPQPGEIYSWQRGQREG